MMTSSLADTTTPTARMPTMETAKHGRSRSIRPDSSAHAPRYQTLFWQRLVVRVMFHAATRIPALSPVTSCRFGDRPGSLAFHMAKRQRFCTLVKPRPAKRLPHPQGLTCPPGLLA